MRLPNKFVHCSVLIGHGNCYFLFERAFQGTPSYRIMSETKNALDLRVLCSAWHKKTMVREGKKVHYNCHLYHQAFYESFANNEAFCYKVLVCTMKHSTKHLPMTVFSLICNKRIKRKFCSKTDMFIS